MPTPPVISDDLMAPITALQPCGVDLQATKDWVELRNARADPMEIDEKGIWEPVQSNWSQLSELASGALQRKSKDLQIARWLAEASIKLFGFAGLRDGLRLIRELVTRYWDSGLYPEMVDGDVGSRCGRLGWLNETMAAAIRKIPITARADGGDNFSFLYYRETRDSRGRRTAEEFAEAVRLTPRARFETMLQDLQQACEELTELDRVVEEKVFRSLVSLNAQSYKTPEDAKKVAAELVPVVSETKVALEEIRIVVEGILREKRRKEPDQPAGSVVSGERSEAEPEMLAQRLPFALEISPEASSNGSWRHAENLVRAGQLEKGLAEMTCLAAAEPNGRARFHRKLLLAEICLSTKREKLAKAVLEELAEQIDKFQLEVWEAPALIGAVWSRLYRCYRGEQAGAPDAERAAKLFDRLCRLDPWQALACSEGKNSSLGQALGS